MARTDELPPGKGRIVHLGEQEVAVYNLEGRYYALALASPVGNELPWHPSSGQTFDALAEDSPARLGGRRCPIAIAGDYLVLVVGAAWTRQ